MLLSMPVMMLCVAAVLAGAGAVFAFARRIPAPLVTFAGLAVAAFSGMTAFGSGSLWFWGMAALIASGIAYLEPVPAPRAMRIYTVAGALAGAFVGLVAGTQTWVIVASAAGAVLGRLAYARTPRGASGALRRDALAAVALPAVVNFSMLMLILAQTIR